MNSRRKETIDLILQADFSSSEDLQNDLIRYRDGDYVPYVESLVSSVENVMEIARIEGRVAGIRESVIIITALCVGAVLGLLLLLLF